MRYHRLRVVIGGPGVARILAEPVAVEPAAEAALLLRREAYLTADVACPCLVFADLSLHPILVDPEQDLN